MSALIVDWYLVGGVALGVATITAAGRALWHELWYGDPLAGL